MANVDASKFEIDSTLELVADEYRAEEVGSALFRNANPNNDAVTLNAGLLDATHQPLKVAHIVDGTIDEYEITVAASGGKQEVMGRIRGRDPSALLLDKLFRKRYVRSPASGAQPPETLPITTITGEKITTPIVYGHVRASQVAQDAVASAGLDLSWEVRDYELFEDFEASGRVIETLRKLIEPWTLVEPFKAEIYLQGKVVIIRQRATTLPYTADYVYSCLFTRRTSITLRKRRARRVGLLTLTGRKDPKGMLGGFSVFEEKPAQAPATTEETFTDTVETFGESGETISKTVTTTTKVMPQGQPVRTRKDVYTISEGGFVTSPAGNVTPFTGGALDLKSREVTDYFYEDVVLDTSGHLNQPQKKRQVTTTHSHEETGGTWQVIEQTEIDYAYDKFGFMSGETQRTSKWDGDKGQLVNNLLVVKTIRDVDALIVEEIVETYTYVTFDDPFVSPAGNVTPASGGRWVLQSRTSAQSAGRRPGGPGRGKSQVGAGSSTATPTPDHIQLVANLTDGETPVAYSNPNLTLDDLRYIYDQFVAANNLYEWELMMSGVAMPWLKRGTKLQVTAIPLEGGLTLTPPPMLITEVKTIFDQSKIAASLTTPTVRLFGWSPGP